MKYRCIEGKLQQCAEPNEKERLKSQLESLRVKLNQTKTVKDMYSQKYR